MVRAFLYGDSHFPFQDERVLNVIYRILGDYTPDIIIHMGDIVDCYHLSSKFDRNPERLHTLQQEINGARQHLHQVAQLVPASRRVLLGGNHEDRLRRLLWGLEGHEAALNSLDIVRQEVTWPKLLGLDDIGFEWIAPADQTKTKILPKFITKHGTIVRANSAYTARAEHAKYGKSGASGHSHRLGMHMHRDHNGNHVWIETGCTCSLVAEYNPDPDWQQGCVVAAFDKRTGAFALEPIYIHNGRAVWRDHVYKA